jgi:recombination protein RecA
MKRTQTNKPLSAQMKRNVAKEEPAKKKYDGNTEIMISTGSTLLDLAISGGRKRGGGLPGGIFVEAFGPSGSGKTVLLSEIAGAVQRQGGEIMFHDPEARLNKQFAAMFDVDFDAVAYTQPDTVTEVFGSIREWQPKNSKKINGIMADSLAALSTDLEMENKDGDKMGMRRAKEFSEQLRKTCRILTQNNWLMVASNQVRVNADAGMYAEKTTTPGGQAVPFYASVRLRFRTPDKIKKEIKVAGKAVTRVIGTQVTVEVYKNSVDKPYRTAPLYIIFDYGIDDIRANLQFVKDYTKNTTYTVDGETLHQSLDRSVQLVEEQGLVKRLKNEVIDLWEEIESQFESDRRKKERD